MGSGFSNDVCVAKNFNTANDGTKDAKIIADGQLLIGAAASPNVRVGTLTSLDGSVTITSGAGTIDLSSAGGIVYPITVPLGGTGRTTFPQGSILIGEVVNPLNSIQLGAGQVIIGSGIAVDPVAYTIPNGNNITWTAGIGTLSANLTGTTNHTIQIGNASGSLTSAAVLASGQLLIGSAGADPVAATLTAGTNVVITNGAGTISIAASTGSPVLSYIESSTTPFVVLATHNVIGIDCSGAIKTVHLPNAPTNTGNSWTIKDYTGNAAANNITVTTPGGAVLIDGAATYTMNVAYSSITVVWSGTAYRVI